MRIVNFSDDELEFLRTLAANFQAAKKGTGASDYRVDGSISNIDMHYIGLKAAFAVSRDLGVDFDRVAYQGQGRRRPMIYFGDLKISVFNRQLHLICYRPFAEDIAVLCNPAAGLNDPFVKSKTAHNYRMLLIVGYCSRDDFIQYKHIKRYGHGAMWTLETRYFRPLSELKERGVQPALI